MDLDGLGILLSWRHKLKGYKTVRFSMERMFPTQLLEKSDQRKRDF